MRKRLSLLILCLCVGLQSVSFAAVRGEGSFRLEGAGRTAQSFPVTVLPNGNLIVSLVSQGGIGEATLSAPGRYRTYMVCVGPQNEILWSRSWNGSTVPGDAVVYSVCRMSAARDGELALLLRQRTPEEGASFLPVVLDAGTGDLLQTGEPIPFEVSDEAADRYITTYNLENLYLQMKTDHASTAQPTGTLWAYDYENRPLWSLPKDALPFDTLSACLDTPAGILLTGTTVSHREDGLFDSHTAFTMVTATGETRWTHTFGDDQSVSMTPALNREGQLMALGCAWDPQSPAAQEGLQCLVCIDPQSGVVQWEQATLYTDKAPLPTGTLLPTDAGYLLFGEGNGQSLVEAVDLQGNRTGLWQSPTASPADYATLQYFLRLGEVWAARMGITPKRTFMQYDRVELNP